MVVALGTSHRKPQQRRRNYLDRIRDHQVPGDILIGDEEGVVVIPRHLAAEIAKPAADQEHLEQFILEKVQSGAALPGTYPANEQTMAEYREWSKSH